MIRYPADPAEAAALDLDARAEKEKPGWAKRAKTRTAKFKKGKAYDERTGIWSEIKGAYMTLQHDKCAYCERRLSDGKIEHALEHYRPKGNVRAWPDAKAIERLTDNTGHCPYPGPIDTDFAGGYYLLAYHTANYCTSCGVCNTNYKSDFFPVAGTRPTLALHPSETTAERPLLLYPLGELDEDPEQLITFIGLTPVPVFQAGPKHQRARVTIDFFNLGGREDLLREREDCLMDFSNALAVTQAGRTALEKRNGKIRRERMKKAASPH